MLREVEDPEAGAVASFVGTVRRRSRERDVGHLEYEAYEEMAEPMLTRLGTELTERHGLCAVAVHHRLGRVEIGEASVVIAVSAPHRVGRARRLPGGDRDAQDHDPALEEGGLRRR